MLGSCPRVLLTLFVSLVAGVLIVPSTATAAYTFGTEVTPIGSFESVFDYSAQPRCGGDTFFFQDAATRAIRDASGREAVIISNAGAPEGPGGHTRRLIGSGGNLANLPFSVDCTVIHSSHNKTAQSTFDNWEWLVSPFTEDGQTFHALVHNEYHGWEHEDLGQCPNNPNPGHFLPRCWYNAITLAKSTNKGDLYTHTSSEPVASHLIASIPYQYSSDPVPGAAEDKGYFQPTNIVKKGSYYYAMFRAEVYQAQTPRGSCLMRTNDLDDPDSWRGWDGTDFTIDFVDPYAEAGTFVPAEHVCKPIDVGDLSTLGANNLVYSRYFKRYMVVDQNHLLVDGTPTDGIFYTLSDDLINWDPPKLLMKAPAAFSPGCSADKKVRVPSLIDPDSTDRNFNTIGQTADLYFEQSQACPETLDRDLLRIKVRFDAKPAGDRLATLEGGQTTDPATGFDTAWNGTPGQFTVDSAFLAYEGSKSGKLVSFGGDTGPWGSFNVNWPNGKEVWYGSAFFLQAGFAAANERIAIARWHNSTAVPPSPTRYGGIVLGTDDRYRLVRGITGGSEDTIGPSFTLPEARWVWLEVHQKLESDPAKGPSSEVFVDGQPVSDSSSGRINSTALNAYPDSAGAPSRVQFGYADRSQGNSTLMWIDRSSVSLSQRGPVGAPPTPGSFSGTEQDGFVTLYWLGARPQGGGFRVYRQDPDSGAWALQFTATSNGVFENVTNCKKYHYRVSAYDAQGHESVVSEPLELMPRPAQGCP